MSFKGYTNKELYELIIQKENKYCFDCGVLSPKWASVNNGIYICINCAGIHRSLGVDISFVRSLTIDHWNPNQILLMQNGGNQRLRELMNEYGIPGDMDPKIKYKLKVIDYYRKLLRYETFGGYKPDKPNLNEALSQIENFKRKEEIQKISNSNFISSEGETNSQKNDKEKGGLFKRVGNFFEKSANDIKNKFQDINFKEKANEFGQKTKNFFQDRKTDIIVRILY